MPVLVERGTLACDAGTTLTSLWRKPLMSPSALRSGAPEGGLTRSCTAVSSMPCAMTLIVIWLVVLKSHVVRFVLPYRVAPVPYMKRLELKGSISKASVIQPSFGLTSAPGRPPPQTGAGGVLSHGAAVMSCV